jgi:hypothetical protein
MDDLAEKFVRKKKPAAKPVSKKKKNEYVDTIELKASLSNLILVMP